MNGLNGDPYVKYQSTPWSIGDHWIEAICLLCLIALVIALIISWLAFSIALIAITTVTIIIFWILMAGPLFF